jgi:hypothetical protein
MIARLLLSVVVVPRIVRGADGPTWAPTLERLGGIFTPEWLAARPEIAPRWTEEIARWQAERAAEAAALADISQRIGVPASEIPTALVRELKAEERIPSVRMLAFAAELDLTASLHRAPTRLDGEPFVVVRARTPRPPGADVQLWRELAVVGGIWWRLTADGHHSEALGSDARVIGARRWTRDADLALRDADLARRQRAGRAMRLATIRDPRRISSMRAKLG